MSLSSSLTASAACAAALVWTTASCAQDFRMETEIYREKEEQPVVENLTLFVGDVVYDFLLTEPEEITVFDFRRGRFILLDPQRRVQTRLATSDIEKFTLAMQTRQADGLLGFLLKPTFDIEVNDENGWLTLGSEQLTYRVRGETPRVADAVTRYRLFADWCARLNAARPGNLPPFARLELNREIAERKWVPCEVQRTLRDARPGPDGQQIVRSKHAILWQLSSSDHERLDRVKRYLASFETVELEQLRQMTSDAAKH